jgi:hypothetical protein
MKLSLLYNFKTLMEDLMVQAQSPHVVSANFLFFLGYPCIL